MNRMKAILVAGVLGIGACTRGSMDTTKDVYDEWDAPEYQIYELNGKEEKIPWKDVPEDSKWLTDENEESLVPWTRYKVHVPIVRVVVWAHDENKNPVDPRKDKVFDGRFREIGLNPKHMRTGILGSRH